MKSLNQYIKESLLDIDDGSVDRQAEEYATAVIKEWIESVYSTTGYTIDLNTHTVDGKGVEVKDKSIDRLMPEGWSWGVVKYAFRCKHCKSLKTLEGAPREVGGDFYCINCDSLKTLEGAPEEVGGVFYCGSCMSLESLEGAPKKVGEDFSCRYCDSLKSLKGAPKKIGGYFNCNHCVVLKSLEGAPEEVGEDFNCRYCDSLKSLKGAPKKIGGVLDLRGCGSLKSLDGLVKGIDINPPDHLKKEAKAYMKTR